MGMTTDDLTAPFEGILQEIGLTLHDLEITNGLVRVTVTLPEGVTVEDLTAANHGVSDYLDDHDPMDRRYTLEVTSPGVERKLRTHAHFVGAIDEHVTIKTAPDSGFERRLDGVLVNVGSEAIYVHSDSGEDYEIPLGQIERARTVYQWAPLGKPSPSRGGSARSRAKSPIVHERILTS